MADYVKIRIRRDTTANWAANNPVLALGEIGADMTLHRIKVGDGVKTWNELPFSDEDIIDNLTSTRTDAALSANQGRALKEEIQNIVASGGVAVIDNLTSTSTTSALSANQGRVLNSKVDSVSNKVDSFGTFGMGYTVDEFNGYGKPTKITFEDGVTATLTWTGTRLDSISSSTGEKITMKYNADGLITGRTVIRA